MATRQQIAAVLMSPEFTDGEKFVIKAQFRQSIPIGNFGEKLWEAMCAADMDNLGKLQLGFPREVEGYLSWTMGDLAERIRKAGCPI